LQGICGELGRLERLRRLECCVLAPALETSHVTAIFVAGGRVVAERRLPPGGGAMLEIEAGLAAARRGKNACDNLSQGDFGLDELLLIDSFLRKPPPELRCVPLAPAADTRARIYAAATEIRSLSAPSRASA